MERLGSTTLADVPPWVPVHDRIVSLGAERSKHEHDLCHSLRDAVQHDVHRHLACSSLAQYANRLLGLRGKQVQERLRVARALDDLPLLSEALATGTMTWSAVRELSRVATAQTEEAWQQWATGRTSREIEQAVQGRRSGARPGDRPAPELLKHVLHFEVRAETLALFRDVQAKLQRAVGHSLDDDAVLNEVARQVLGGPTKEGRASYQVAAA